MTFTEAALEVLRSAGEPLHYKRITELAIERNLLSHVGKTPEVTMSSRLAMMVKKDRGQAPIIKVKPGVFAIRESAKEELSQEALAAIQEVEAVPEQVSETSEAGLAEAVVVIEVKPPALPGGDVFPEEEGDDDPILAGLEQESEAGDRNGRRRRRRRRRGKNDKPDAAVEAPVRAEPVQVREVREPREAHRGDRDRGRERDRAPSRDSRSSGRDSRDSGRDSRDSGRDNRDSGRESNRDRAPREEQLDFDRQPAEGDLLGKDLADAVWHVLSRGERVPHGFARVAELLVRRGRLSGSPMALAPTIAASVRADVARAELTQARPRFRVRGGRMALSEWLLPKQLVRSEQDFSSASERYANELRRALIQKLSELPTAGFAELIATWLNAEGIIALRAVRRPGSTSNELHFAGTRRSGSEETRLAIVVLRGGRDIDREAVNDVRGALHHYGQASAAWIVTTGRSTSGAREEAGAQGAAACALFDGMALATAMERLGIAVRRYVIAHHELDYDLLEGLGDTPEQRERREREEAREQRYVPSVVPSRGEGRPSGEPSRLRAPDQERSRRQSPPDREVGGETLPPTETEQAPVVRRDPSAGVRWEDSDEEDEPELPITDIEASDDADPEGEGEANVERNVDEDQDDALDLDEEVEDVDIDPDDDDEDEAETDDDDGDDDDDDDEAEDSDADENASEDEDEEPSEGDEDEDGDDEDEDEDEEEVEGDEEPRSDR